MAAAATTPTPDYHVLNFFQDDQGGSALTVLAGATRYHVIVDEKELKDAGKKGASIRKEYRDLCDRVKRQDEALLEGKDLRGEKDDAETTFSDGTHDSGVDMTADTENSTSKAASTDACEQLQKWIMAPLADVLDKKEMLQKHKTVQDWYYCPTKLYQLYIDKGKLIGREEEVTSDLDERMAAWIPDMPLPKYLRDLQIDMISAKDVQILSESTDPEPIHPALVSVHGEKFFLKVVDMNQLQPTKREIHLMKRMEKKGLHEQFRMPLIRGLVAFSSSNNKRGMKSSVMGFLMTLIPSPTPLTHKLDSSIPQSQRDTWANECAKIVKILHDNDIIWGDAKADNFMVDEEDNLWIIDFGGSYTEGWVDPELKETVEGDDMGLRKVTAALHDPEGCTYDPNEDGEEKDETHEEEAGGEQEEGEEEGKKAVPKLKKESSLFVTEVVSETKAIRAVSSSAEIDEEKEEEEIVASESGSKRKRKTVDSSDEETEIVRKKGKKA
jgi:serine/threonine protein kinase